MVEINGTPWPNALTSAQVLFSKGKFSDGLSLCVQIMDAYSTEPDALLNVGTLLHQSGFLTNARLCFSRVRALIPKDSRAVACLANLAREAGEHEESRRLYAILLQHFPNNPVIRRNALLSYEYDPNVSDIGRLNHAREWGEWAITLTQGPIERPPILPLEKRPLRIGYVSSDLCQHTVGLFVKDIIKSHSEAVEVFIYSSGMVKDQITNEIQGVARFNEVGLVSDIDLANLIRQDRIDVLIDLSGHTAGSRLTLFAHRPAPVQVSWIGYFATTGLAYMDGVLLDKWHAPEGTEAWFVEPIIRLKTGRLCYTPVSFAPPEEKIPPCIKKGFITFGCFNNTAKLNSRVFDVWGKILKSLPKSRLILKWRTFHDSDLCRKIQQAFFVRGITQDRIEFRGFSFHVDMLKEYAEIDIALDPFPFTGGLTTCEALWMGAPVVTFPQTRVVSRQSFAVLSAIGLSDLSATTEADYIDIACALSKDINRLKQLRIGMRDRMQHSSLMNPKNFIHNLEQSLIELYREIYQKK